MPETRETETADSSSEDDSVNERPDPIGGARTTDVSVLLVDDNEQWGTFVARELERYLPGIDVTTATSANEGLRALRGDQSLECVVADYQMPEMDGLQFLERVREEHPHLPFILVTAAGSEDVASRAINAGTTDYLVKDPSLNQAPLLANRIDAAVTEFRLRRAVEESEERYRTITEQSHEAILIVQNERVAFHNRRLETLTGRSAADLQDCDPVAALVHPDDREDVRRAVGTDHERSADALYEVRLVTADGAVRHCEYTSNTVTYREEPAALVSIRDVTDRRRRERELQWERDLNRTVQRALVEARTRADLERAVTEQLTDYGYALAWIGERDGDAVRPRTVVGDDTGYVEDATLERTGGTDEPGVWAVRTGEAQFLGSLDDLFETAWSTAARERGYRSAAAVPLCHDDVPYGVLVVSHREPDRFDGTERRLLTGLADTVAYAINSIENTRALTADQPLDVRVELRGDRHFLTAVLDRCRGDADAALSVEATVPHDDGFVQYVTVRGPAPGRFVAAATGHDAVDDAVDVGDGRVQLHLAGTPPEARLAAHGAVVTTTSVAGGAATVDLALSARDDLGAAVEDLRGPGGSVSVLSCTTADADAATADADLSMLDAADLTQKQATALRSAYHHGYFEQPRRSSASEVAESLGISHSTFLQHLRVAQQKAFGTQFD